MSIVDHNVGKVQIVMSENYLMLVGGQHAIQAIAYKRLSLVTLPIGLAELNIKLLFAIKWACRVGC